MTKTCEICLKEYSRRSKDIGKFCSSKCFGQSRLGISTWCKGVKTGLTPWLGKKRSQETKDKIRATKLLQKYTHSQEVRKKISLKMLGVSKGGVSSIASLIRGMTLYKQWRNAVFKRDDYTCQECGQVGGTLNADHIEKFSTILRKFKIDSLKSAVKCRELWNIENGRTLCLHCHISTLTFGNRKVKISTI